MALHTLEELHSRTADYISDAINKGFKIDPSVYSENKFIFTTKLVDSANPNINLIIKTVQDDHKCTFTRQFIPARELHMSYEELSNLKTVYYLSYNDVYAESKEEAIDARNKFYANALGVDDTNNPVQSFVDKLGAVISDMLRRSDNESK